MISMMVIPSEAQAERRAKRSREPSPRDSAGAEAGGANLGGSIT